MEREEIQEQALKATEGRRRCSVVLGTGVGKTLVGLLHIERNTNAMQNVLVVAPKKSIFQSWSDDAVKFGKQDLLERITFSTYIGLPKRDPNAYDYVYLDELFIFAILTTNSISSSTSRIIYGIGNPSATRPVNKCWPSVIYLCFLPEITSVSIHTTGLITPIVRILSIIVCTCPGFKILLLSKNKNFS